MHTTFSKNHVTSVYYLARIYIFTVGKVQLKDEFPGVKFQENVAHVHSSPKVRITSAHPGHIPEGLCFTNLFFNPSHSSFGYYNLLSPARCVLSH